MEERPIEGVGTAIAAFVGFPERVPYKDHVVIGSDDFDGWGTDEDAIYGALSGRTQADIDEITKAYRKYSDDGLDADLRDELTEGEYEQRVGWGHSSVEHAVTFASLTGAGRVVFFHHDPMHSDDDLDELADRARELWQGPGRAPALAREGMVIDLAAHALAADGRSR